MTTIMHLINTAGPGGAETVCYGLVTGLDRERWRSITVVPNEGWITEVLRKAGHDPFVLPSRRRLDFSYYRGLLHLLDRHRVGLIQSHYFGPSVTASRLGLARRKPVVATLHGTGDMESRSHFDTLKLGILRRGVHRAVFVSEQLRTELQPLLGIADSCVRVIENGADPIYFDTLPSPAVRSELASAPGSFLIGASGNVRPAKGYDVLLRAMAILRSSLPTSQLVIAGQADGQLFVELMGLSAELGLTGAVRFLGFRPDLPRLLPNLDAFVVSSNSEGFSLATVEAQAAGVPVVATRCGGPETIIDDGATGLLVPRGDPAALARALLLVHRDPVLRDRLGAAGKAAAAARFTLQRQVQRYEDLYTECLTGRATESSRFLPPREGAIR